MILPLPVSLTKILNLIRQNWYGRYGCAGNERMAGIDSAEIHSKDLFNYDRLGDNNQGLIKEFSISQQLNPIFTTVSNHGRGWIRRYNGYDDQRCAMVPSYLCDNPGKS